MTGLGDTCPCCNGPRAPGLFEQPIRVRRPAVADALHGADDSVFDEDAIVEIHGRYFLRAFASLPLQQEFLGVFYDLWVEISSATRTRALEVWSKEAPELLIDATLACDWPGFADSLGASCTVVLAWGDLPMIVDVDDARIARSGQNEQTRHAMLERLYRRGHGGPSVLLEAATSGWRIRRDTVRALASFAGRPPLVRAVPPPPACAGLFLLPSVADLPPLDTGGEALLATVGNAEACAPGLERELVVVLRDPPAELSEAFAQLAYGSRLYGGRLEPGMLLGDGGVIAGTRALTRWLVCPSGWAGAGPVPISAVCAAADVEFLPVVAIGEEEARVVEAIGYEMFLVQLELAELDPADASRALLVR